MAFVELSVLRTVVGISALVFTAKILGGICSRYKIPDVVGEVMAGVVLGPFALGGIINMFGGPLVQNSELLSAFYLIAGIIVLFAAGLEFTFGQFRARGLASLTVGGTGVVIALVLGYLVPLELGFPSDEAILIGAALAATSIIVTVRILEDMGKLHSPEGQVMVNAAIIDDVLGLAVLAVVTSIIEFGVIPQPLEIGQKVVTVLALWLGLLLVSVFILPKLINLATLWRAKGTVETAATASCFGMALVATVLGLSPIVGAFAAGMAVAEAKAILRVREYVNELKIIFGPLFFSLTGALVDPGRLLAGPFLSTFLLVSGVLTVAVVSKILGCGIPAAFFLRSRRKGLSVGIGMASRGEVAFLIAGIGVTSRLVSQEVYSAIIIVTLATTIISPTLLRRNFESEERMKSSSTPNPELDSTASEAAETTLPDQ